MTGRRGTPSQRLNRRLVVRESGCIEWTGPTHRGYGLIGTGRGAEKKMVRTHRLAWMLANGPIPEGFQVCHTCDNPPCCNVAHLWLGTPAQNAADKIAKGRDQNQQKTHCPQGHPYDDANTYVAKAGQRHCRTCMRAANTRWASTLGKGPAMAARTHCPAGHEYDEANTYIFPNGNRKCRACRAAGARAATKKARAK